MTVSYWIQRADFSSTDHDAVREDEAVEAFDRQDWNAETAFERTLRSSRADYCPPGIGFVAAPGHLLHICPNVEDALVHYHFTERGKALGLFPVTRSKVVSASSVPLSAVPELIRLFASGQAEALRMRLEHAAPR